MPPQESNVVKIVPRRGLFNEVAVPIGSEFTNRFERFDVERLVNNKNVRRQDLEIILTDDEVAQCVEQRIGKILAVDYRLDSTGGTSGEQDIFLREQLDKHYNTIVTGQFNAILYGYSVMERIYKSGQYIEVEHVIEKPLNWFQLNYKKELFFILRNGAQGELLDTEFKFLLTTNKITYRRPNGRSLLALAFWAWFYRNANWQFWMQFLERNGAPLLVGYGNNPEQIAQQLAGAVQDAVIGVPKDSKVELLENKANGVSFDLAEDKLVRRLQKLFLGQTLTSDTGKGGNGGKAAMTGSLEVLQEKTVYDIQQIGPSTQNFVDALSKINFPGAPIPKVVYDLGKGLETERANRDVQLLNTKAIAFTPMYYKRNYNFKDDEFTLLDGSNSVNSPRPVDPKTQINNPQGQN